MYLNMFFIMLIMLYGRYHEHIFLFETIYFDNFVIKNNAYIIFDTKNAIYI